MDEANTNTSTFSGSVLRARFLVLFLPCICIALASAEVKAGTPDLASFLSGHLSAIGLFKNYRDGTTRGIRVDVHGQSHGDIFRLATYTTFSDGKKEQKVWTFRKTGAGTYLGQRADLVGAANVTVGASTVILSYTAKVPTEDKKIYDVSFKETFQFSQPGKATYTVDASFLSIPVGKAHLIVRKLSR